MSAPGNCPNCDNIYGNEPRKIPCGHIICHKCCLELFNKDDNTLICPECDQKYTFKSKNAFKKSLLQVAHTGFGKKAIREIGFASTMPVEKASGAEKAAIKEVKKAVPNLPTAPPGAPPDVSSPPSQPPPPPPVALVQLLESESSVVVVNKPPPTPISLMPTRPTISLASDTLSKVSKQQPTLNKATLSSLFNTIVKSSSSSSSSSPPPPPLPPPSSSLPSSTSAVDAVIARCHSCGDKCQVIVCEHCDHFVCLKCAEQHRTVTKVNAQDLRNKWQDCKNKYSILIKRLNQYNHEKVRIESDLAAIRVAVEQRSRDAIQFIINQRDSLTSHINEHIEKEQTINSIKHNDLAHEFRQIQNRLESALTGENIGSYTQDNFLHDIHELQNRMNKRNSLIETHILQIPIISRYEQVSIEKLLGELHFNAHTKNDILNRTKPLVFHDQMYLPPTNLPDCSPEQKPAFIPRISSPASNNITSTLDMSNIKPLMADACPNGAVDAFEEFRRMAAQIHQQFNAPYSKIINPASTVPSTSSDGSQNTDGIDKNSKKTVNKPQSKISSTSSFTLQWKIEHTAVPNFLCMTPYPIPKVFILDKYGKVAVCSIPPKQTKPYETYTLFPNGTDELIESAVVSSRFLIVYSRKKQDTMGGKLYFFNHECKLVLPHGIAQNIPVHHILCDQNANRLYCLDRMRCIIYYYTLPHNPNEIESCMKARIDFTHFNSNYLALKMLQNDDVIGFYERHQCIVHLYDKKTEEKIEEFKSEHFIDKFESWGIIAIRKDNNSFIFKVDERIDHEAVNRQHIVYEVNRFSKQVISQIQLNSVFGMIIGPNNEVILGIRQTKDSGAIQCYVKK